MPTGNITFSGETLKVSLRKKVLIKSSLLFSMVTEAHARVARHEKEMTSFQAEEKKVRLLLFADCMIFYLENLLELTNQ